MNMTQVKDQSNVTARRAFTLVELLVVVGIVALLTGLLLPALGQVIQRARAAQTRETMESFARACDAYYIEFGEHPAVIPSSVLYLGVTDNPSDPLVPQNLAKLTQMENALLALMGGYRLESDADYSAYTGTELVFNTTPPFRIKIDAARMGEGPMKNGRKYDAFFAPKGSVLSTYSAAGLPSTDSRRLTLAQLIRHPALEAAGASNASDADRVWSGTARGKFFLFSAGPDGIFFSRSQVRTPDGQPMTDIISRTTNPNGPRVVELFDDIVVAGDS